MYEEQKKELVRICHLLYDKNLVTAADGNVSARVSQEHILLTPSGKSKGFVEEADILCWIWKVIWWKEAASPAGSTPCIGRFMRSAPKRER